MIRRVYRWLMPAVTAGFPLHRFNNQHPPPEYSGLVVTSDIDATYLQTAVHSLRGLVRAALEKAEEKRTIPGMLPILRAFRDGIPSYEEQIPLYFVSASPPQMLKVLAQKMELDQLVADGITLKDPLRLLRRGRITQIKQHVLYKLTALLLNRCERASGSAIEEILLGDDSESDAEIYLLYARILEEHLSEKELRETFDELGATSREQENLLVLARRQDKSRVKRIYIHRTFARKVEDLPSHSPDLLLAAKDAFQIAIDAYVHGWFTLQDVRNVALELDVLTLASSIKEAQERELFHEDIIETVHQDLESIGINIEEAPDIEPKPLIPESEEPFRSNVHLDLESALPSIRRTLEKSAHQAQHLAKRAIHKAQQVNTPKQD